MSLLSRLEHALEALAEGGAEQVFGGRLDLVAVGQELFNAAVEHSRGSGQGPEAPSLFRVEFARDDYGELGDEVERLQREYERSVWRRLRDGGYALAAVPRVFIAPLDEGEPGRFRVAAEFDAGPPTCVLTVLGPKRAVHQVELPAVIGRDPECTLGLDNPSVSRRHAEVRWDRNCFLLVDLGSKNGTLRNGAPVTVSPLEPGDVIVLGTERVRLTVTSATEPVDPAEPFQV